MNLTLNVLPGRYAICRLSADDPVPGWARPGLAVEGAVAAGAGGFLSLTRTADELSIVCPEAVVPAAVRSDRGWRCPRVEGPLDLSLTGVLASILAPLAEAQVNIFAVSTYDTDHILVKEERLARAREALSRAGHRVALD